MCRISMVMNSQPPHDRHPLLSDLRDILDCALDILLFSRSCLRLRGLLPYVDISPDGVGLVVNFHEFRADEHYTAWFDLDEFIEASGSRKTLLALVTSRVLEAIPADRKTVA